MLVRRAQPADAPALTELAVRAKSHWGYPAEWLEQWHDALTITAEYLDAHPAFVAVAEGIPAGVCVLQLRGNDTSLEHMWVAPEFHRSGVGRALVTRALEEADRLGACRIIVESDPFAEGFYLRLGAHRIGEVPAPMPGSPARTLPQLEFRLEPPPP